MNTMERISRSICGFGRRCVRHKTGVTVLHKYDHVLSAAILDELETLSGVQIYGITDRTRLDERVLTVSLTWEGRHPRDIATALGEQGIFVWDGKTYARWCRGLGSIPMDAIPALHRQP